MPVYACHTVRATQTYIMQNVISQIEDSKLVPNGRQRQILTLLLNYLSDQNSRENGK